jgi:hypothetical protein
VEQVLVLPVSFIDYGRVRILIISRPVDGLLGVFGSANGMGGDVGGGDGLTGGTGGGAGGVIFSDFAGGGMGGEGSAANDCHFELAGIYPALEGFEGLLGAVVLGVSLLKVGQDTVGAVYGPAGEGFVVGLFHKLDHRLVFAV